MAISSKALSFLKSIGLEEDPDVTTQFGTGDADLDAFAQAQANLASGKTTIKGVAAKDITVSPDEYRASLTEETFAKGGYTAKEWGDVKLGVLQKGKPQVKDKTKPETVEDIINEEPEVDSGPSAEDFNSWIQQAAFARDNGEINQATFDAYIKALTTGIWPGSPEWPKPIADPDIIPEPKPNIGGGGKMGGGLLDILKDLTLGGSKFGVTYDSDTIHKSEDLLGWMADQQSKGLRTFTTEEWQQAMGYTPTDRGFGPGSSPGVTKTEETTPTTEKGKAAEIAAQEQKAISELSSAQILQNMRGKAPKWWPFDANGWPPTKQDKMELTPSVDWGKIRELASAYDPDFNFDQAKQLTIMETDQKIKAAQRISQQPFMQSQSQFMQIPGMDVGIPVMRNPDGSISQINVPTLDKQIDRAIITGDSSRARQLINIRDMPSATEKLNLALQIAQSPADAFQISRLAGGEQMDRFGEAAPYLQNAIKDIFGPTSDPFRNLGSQPGGPYGFAGGALPAGVDMQQLQTQQRQGDPVVNQMLSQMGAYQDLPAFQPTISPEAMSLAQNQGQFPTQMSIGPDGKATPFDFSGYQEPGAVGSMYQGSMTGQPLDYGQQGMGGATTSNDIRNTLTQGDERFGGGGFGVDPEMEAWKRAQGGQATDLGRQLSQAGYGWLANQNKSSFGPNKIAPTQATYNAPPVSQSMYNTQNTGFKAGDTVGGLPARVGNPLLEGTAVDRPSSIFSTLGLTVPSMQATENWLPEERQLAESYVKGLGIDPNRLWDEVQIGTPGGGKKPGIRWKESFLD